jgi:hypothetical protein
MEQRFFVIELYGIAKLLKTKKDLVAVSLFAALLDSQLSGLE